MRLGEFQTAEEIGWGEDSTVYAAVAPGEGKEPLACKTRAYFEPAEGDALLMAVKEQRTSATACPGLAPIVSCGLEGHYCYAVMKRYSRSVHTLIQGKVVVRGAGLEALTRQVLQTLRLLQDKQGRGHGNLKPSNILLQGTGRLRDSTAFLADVAGKPAEPGADLQALGRALYQLVRRREVQSIDWPLAASKDWEALGPEGGAWREICNGLLDPALARAPDPLRLAEALLAKSLGGGGASKKGGKSWLPLAAVGVLAAALAGAGYYYFLGPRTSRPGALGFPSALPASESDPVQRLAAELQANPRWQSADPYAEEKIAKPLRGGAAPGPEASQAVRAALEVWPARAVVAQAGDDFNARGWTAPAGTLLRLRRGLDPEGAELPRLVAIAEAARLLPQIEQRWRGLQEGFAGLERTADPVLARVPAYLTREAGQESDLGRLLSRLEGDQGLVERLLQAARSVDRDRLGREGLLGGFRGELTAETLRQWESEAARFEPAPDEASRIKAAWSQRLADLGARFPAGRNLLAETERELDAMLRGMLRADVPRVDDQARARLAEAERQLAAAPASPAPPAPGPPANLPVPVPPPPASAPAPPPTATNLPAIPDSDGQIFDRLLGTARAGDFSSANSARTGRDRFLAEVKNNTSAGYQAKIGTFLASVSAFRFGEGGPALAPPIPGWTGPSPTASGVAYTWGRHRLEMTLIAGEGAPFYLESTELPMGLAFDWIGQRSGNFSAVGLRADAGAKGPRGWETRANIPALRGDWTWVTSMVGSFPFYPAGAKVEPPNPGMPLNYLSSRGAVALAEAMGLRLPSAEEWQRAYQLSKKRGWDSQAIPNRRDGRWEKQRKYVADCVAAIRQRGAELRDPPWPDGDIFIPNRLSVPREAAARPAAGEEDGVLWFTSTELGVGKPMNDLVGNVAEFVTAAGDASGARVFVVGASALSPAEVEPATPYELSAVQRTRGFADVGLRLALSPAKSAGDSSPDLEAYRRLLQTGPKGG